MLPTERETMRRTASFYDEEAGRYDRRWRSPVGRYINETQQTIVLDACDFRDKRVIEVGAGSGRFTALLAAHGAHVTAVDVSPTMLRTTRERLALGGGGDQVHLISASADALPFSPGQFEAGLCVNVFSHLRPFKQAVREIGRVLSPGGTFLANFPNLSSPWFPVAALVNLTGRSVFRNVYTHWYRWVEIDHAYRAAGLQLEQVIGHVYLPACVKGQLAVGPLRVVDSAFRHSWLRHIAPVVFIRARKR